MRNFVTILFEIAFSYEVAITILYWAVLFRGFDGEVAAYRDVAVHGLPLAALLIDFIFNSFGFEIKRYLIVAIFGTAYLLTNLAYSLGV